MGGKNKWNDALSDVLSRDAGPASGPTSDESGDTEGSHVLVSSGTQAPLVIPGSARRGAHRGIPPGTLADGSTSPLIRSRADDVRWLLTSRLAKMVIALLLVAALMGAIWMYAIPATRTWWEQQTTLPAADPTIVYIAPSPSPSEASAVTETAIKTVRISWTWAGSSFGR